MRFCQIDKTTVMENVARNASGSSPPVVASVVPKATGRKKTARRSTKGMEPLEQLLAIAPDVSSPRLTIKTLRKAMRESRKADYNRQLTNRILKDADPTASYPTELLLIHEHRHFVRCEPHARLGIDVKLSSGEVAFVFLDVPMDFWNQLKGGAM